jgi:[protein-PII] uridylyltransferase
VVEVVGDEFPTAEQVALMAERRQVIDGRGHVLTVIAPDRPGLFSRVAGVLALHGLAVQSASAHSSDDGMALSEYRVESAFEPGTGPVVAWDRVAADVELALAGRLALQARIADRARTYDRQRHPQGSAVSKVSFDNSTSSRATVIDVQAPDGVGVLYRVTRALAELDLDIRSARITTLGHQAVDAFYVTDAAGSPVTDEAFLGEIERAVLFAVSG